MSQTSLAHGNAALATNDPFESLKTLAIERGLTGEGKITIGGITSKLAYAIKKIADEMTEVAVTIGEGVGSAVQALIHRPVLAVAGASLGLAALPWAQIAGRAAIMLDGTTRAQMTAPNPALDGFFANASGSVGGFPVSNHLSLTHLWGPYYAGAAHEAQNGINLGNIYLGRDYVNNSGDPIAITNVAFSPTSDLMIITAATADDTPRNANSRIVGIAVATTSSATIYDTLAAPANLAFINQITGSSITEEQILAGQSIIGAPTAGQHIWSQGYGAWGTPATGVSNPDGLPGQWQGMYMPNGGGLADQYSDPILYFGSSFANDGGLSYGPLNGHGASIDSGSVGIVTVPEPTSLALLVVGIGGLIASRTRQRRPM